MADETSQPSPPLQVEAAAAQTPATNAAGQPAQQPSPTDPQKGGRRSLVLQNDNELYRFLTTYYLHQDKLRWSRIQTLIAIEALALAGPKVGTFVGIVGLLLGSISIWLLLILIVRDRLIRDQHNDVLDTVHEPRGIRLIEEGRELNPHGGLEGRAAHTMGSSIILKLVQLMFAANAIVLVWLVWSALHHFITSR